MALFLEHINCRLFEGGFLSNSNEARKIASSSHRKKIAKALADGIDNYKKALR